MSRHSIIPRRDLVAGRAAGRLLSRLPRNVLAVLKSELHPVGRLDYPARPIAMNLNSAWQVYRLRSCAKEPETVRWIETELRPGDCFYDIGANVGAYSFVAFAASGGQATIVAFEPGFGTFAELCGNIQLNGAQGTIIPLPIALGDRHGLAEFRYSDVSPGAARHSWDAALSGGPPELVLRTPTFTLDGLVATLGLPQPSLLKLDVDGPELEVLRGATKVLSDPLLRTCLVELDEESGTAATAISLMEDRGFRVQSRHVRGGGGPLYNVIFSRT